MLKINMKFKIRIKYHSDYKYIIQYSHYWLFPFWWDTLTRWMDMFGNWNPVLLDFEDAEKFAMKFKSIDDINAWYKRENGLERQWHEKQKEEYNQRVPYQTKIISK